MLQVHHGVALSRSPQEHVHNQTTPSHVDPDPRISLPYGVAGVSTRRFDPRRPRFAVLLWPTRNLGLRSIGDLEPASGGSISSAFSSCHIYDTGLLTPPRRCTHKMRRSTHSSPGRLLPPFNWHCITQDNGLPLHPYTSPPSFLSQLPSASTTKTPPQRTANNHALLPTRTAGRPRVLVRPCPFAAHGGSRAVSRITYPVRAGHTRGYHHTERPRRVHGRTARRQGYRSRLDDYLRWSTAWKYAFRAKGRGWGVCTSTNGRGRVVEVPWAVWSLQPAGMETCRPRVGYRTSWGPHT